MGDDNSEGDACHAEVPKFFIALIFLITAVPSNKILAVKKFSELALKRVSRLVVIVELVSAIHQFDHRQ